METKLTGMNTPRRKGIKMNTAWERGKQEVIKEITTKLIQKGTPQFQADLIVTAVGYGYDSGWMDSCTHWNTTSLVSQTPLSTIAESK